MKLVNANGGGNMVIAGRIVGDVVFKEVGEKKYHTARFGVGVSKDEIINVQVWYDLADACKNRLKKGDVVLCAGLYVSSEYNGKNYWNLNAEFVTKNLINEVDADGMTVIENLTSADIPF